MFSSLLLLTSLQIFNPHEGILTMLEPKHLQPEDLNETHKFSEDLDVIVKTNFAFTLPCEMKILPTERFTVMLKEVKMWIFSV